MYLEVWSTAGGTGATKVLAYKVGPRSDKKVLIRMTTDALAWGAAVGAGKTDVPLKKWTHIAGTYDAKSGEGKIYLPTRDSGTYEQKLMNKGIEGVLAVKPQDKLTITWGKLKSDFKE